MFPCCQKTFLWMTEIVERTFLKGLPVHTEMTGNTRLIHKVETLDTYYLERTVKDISVI